MSWVAPGRPSQFFYLNFLKFIFSSLFRNLKLLRLLFLVSFSNSILLSWMAWKKQSSSYSFLRAKLLVCFTFFRRLWLHAAKRTFAVPLKKRIFLSEFPVVAFLRVSGSVAEPLIFPSAPAPTRTDFLFIADSFIIRYLENYLLWLFVLLYFLMLIDGTMTFSL
jgi:hypothetical protein